MPTYTFVAKDDEEEKDWWESIMTISEMEQFLVDHPDVRQIIGSPTIGDPHRLSAGKHKPDDAFRDLLRDMKKKKPRNTINTF